MNVNRLYIAQIYMCMSIVYKCPDGSIVHSLPSCNEYDKNVKAIFVKQTIVYHKGNNCYVDLRSKEVYKFGVDKVVNIGDMYISLEKGIRPIENIFDRENMSRKRIIKKLFNSKLLDKKEEDK